MLSELDARPCADYRHALQRTCGIDASRTEMLSFLCQLLCMSSSSMPAVHVESCQRTMRRQEFFWRRRNERTMDCAKRNSKERFVVECVGIRLRVPPPGYGWQGDAEQI